VTRKILITGAAGNMGEKLTSHFTQRGTYELKLLDRTGGAGIVAADLGDFDATWSKQFETVDTVVHLAGDPRGTASWAEVTRANITVTQNVLRAAHAAGVRRVVFASTNQVMLGYRFREGKVTTDLPPAPLSPYGFSKLFCEHIGQGFAKETGISFIALRIGYFQRGENLPGPWMGIGVWGQQMWLSNRDMLHGVTRAIDTEDVPFAIVNFVSDNPGMRWDLEHTRKTIGYEPQDGHAAVIDDKIIAEDERARSLQVAPGTWLNEYFHPVAG
jgi:NAD+ dependent glucose-6-phosphate dehydrogenase